ncbi:hypothetical protein McanMca71_000397 [Microsporum canis]|uniref:Proline-rich antigen n=1 Tax=Arthroderma otae (strain ATCC MYA-4605 / CBS 113480) TaxID=554155 RepID=C5FK46_ARTOC|nr:proline-rich antigen [Microsporum canis CBS 113480]EEQ30068.1 proline-rich antigen [Microsporum canis CBS 113480]
MKFSQAVVALAAATVVSAQLPDVPPCSLSCFVDALGSDGCSDLTDFKCHCSKAELPSKITPCVKAACPVEDQIKVSNAVVDQCSKAGNPISIPPVGESSSEPAESSTEAPTASPTESESTPAPSTTAAPTGTGSPSGTGAPGGPSGTGTFTNTGVPTQSTPIYTGAASGLTANVGGMGAALLALAAYL